MVRKIPPNLLVTGTPGTGKSTLCAQVAQLTGFKHINVSEMAKGSDLCEGYDEERNSHIIDEDKFVTGGFVVTRWFDLVVVLQTDNSVLYKRLQKRGYPEAKVRENVTCEIMQVIVDEARESYKEEIVKVVSSNTVDEMERNVEQIQQWIASSI